MASVVTLIAVVLSVVGIIMILSSATKLSKALAPRKWDATTGKIISSKVVNGAPIVEYEYDAYNVAHNGKMIRAVTPKYTQADADEVVAQYPAGKQLTVFVNPASPDQAVLETETAGEGRNVIIGAVLLVISIPLFYTAFHVLG